MHIQHIEVGNFRKLKAVRIDFSETNTVFVGANNSGKTSAMVALRRFLVDRSDFSINDFTLTMVNDTVQERGSQARSSNRRSTS